MPGSKPRYKTPEVPIQNLPIRNIPQEIASRSGIFAVCFCFLFSIAPHFSNLPLWVSGIVIASLCWRILENLGRMQPIPGWLLATMVVFGGLSVFAEYWTVVGRDAGLALLTVMTSFKFLECRKHRDLLILVFLCYFLIATHFLFSQSILTAALMFITLIVITATLITINQRDDRVPILSRLKISSRMVAMSIPLMLILFILVPRIPGPLWGIPNDQRGGVTGLSNTMSPGKISNLIRSNKVAFRVDFTGLVPLQSKLYWRGPVMSMFNGRSWYQSRRHRINSFNIEKFDEEVEYTVTLEPNGEHWLLALDIPTRLVKGSLMTADFQITSKDEINDLRRYTMKSRLGSQIGKDESIDYLELTSKFPDNSNKRTIALGEELSRRYANPEDIVQHVLTMFSKEGYVYTLRPPILVDNEVDRFLFDSKRGFCENYAGSFALLMRAAGIPARIVAGYQGGEFNRVGNYLIVRQSDAHAWTEVWLIDRGWVRVDPTAAVSPSRIELGLDIALGDEVSSFRIQYGNPLFGNLLYSWDNLQHDWNDWVLNYDQRKQGDFLRDLNIGIENWSDMVFALMFMLLLVTGSYWLASYYRERPAKPETYEIYFKKLLKKLKKRGLEKKPSEDSREFLHRIESTNLSQKSQLTKIIELYMRIKYGRRTRSTLALNNLRSLVNSIKL
jgi:transglutaminase-like putative cysteine protease